MYTLLDLLLRIILVNRHFELGSFNTKQKSDLPISIKRMNKHFFCNSNLLICVLLSDRLVFGQTNDSSSRIEKIRPLIQSHDTTLAFVNSRLWKSKFISFHLFITDFQIIEENMNINASFESTYRLSYNNVKNQKMNLISTIIHIRTISTVGKEEIGFI
jgi:hypothetical protein